MGSWRSLQATLNVRWRAADVLRMSTDHIASGMLHVRQGKTAAKLRIEVTGALQELLAEIQAYKVQLKADTALLLVNEAGQPLTKNMLRNRFDPARDAAGIPKAQFQFRDLRATAATTVDDDGGYATRRLYWGTQRRA